MDRLVIFTSHYPYGNGEPFLEEEIRTAESLYNEIIIVSFAKHNEAVTRYIPHNSKIINLRKDSNKSKLYEALLLSRNIFKPKVWREICCGIRERGLKKLLTIIKTLLLYERHIEQIKKNEGSWMNGNCANTVFYSYWLNAAAVYLSRNNNLDGIRICRAHGGDCFFDREYVPWRKAVIDKIDKVFSISDGGKNDLIFHYGKFVKDIDKKITVSRLGVNIPGQVKESSCFGEEYIIVTCSNVIPLKRLDLLVYALADEKIKHNIRWVHFGDGPQLEEISALADKLLKDSACLTYEFKGRKPKKEILSFYNENPVRLFINCSDTEGIPVSVMEAMSYGIPAVARDVGCNRELVSDACGALLPSVITPGDLAECINNLLNENDEIYNKKRRAATETVSNNYNTAVNYKMFFSEIEEMLREKANEQTGNKCV